MWAAKFWTFLWKITLGATAWSAIEKAWSALTGLSVGLFAKAKPELVLAAVEKINDEVLAWTDQAVSLAAVTITQLSGLPIDTATLSNTVKGPSGRPQIVAIGDAFIPMLNSIFSIPDAVADFQTRTGTAGSATNMSAYFGTNLLFQLRSLTISTIADIFGFASLRHLEGLHQSINWAFGFGWLSWTVMSTIMEATVLPGLRRLYNSQVKYQDYTETQLTAVYLAGQIDSIVFGQVADNLALRDDIRTPLLNIREADLGDGNLRDLFQEGRLTEADVKAAYRLKGYRDTRAGQKTDLVTLDRTLDILRSMDRSQERLFRDDVTTETDLRQWLALRNYTSDEQDLVVGWQELERRQRRFLSMGELQKALELGLLDSTYVENYLMVQGFTEIDATVLIIIMLEKLLPKDCFTGLDKGLLNALLGGLLASGGVPGLGLPSTLSKFIACVLK